MVQGNHVDHGRSHAGFPKAWERKWMVGGASDHGSLGEVRIESIGVFIIGCSAGDDLDEISRFRRSSA